MSTSSSSGPRSRGSAAGAADRLSQSAAALVHDEVEAVREEAMRTLRRGGTAAALLAAAGVAAGLTALTAHQTLLRALERWMSPVCAAGLLTTVYAAGAAAAGYQARERIRAAAEASESTLDRAREDLGSAVKGPDEE